MNDQVTSIESILEDELTVEQRAAVTDESTDVLVVACAGSGKSRTLAYRIAWLISQGADPRSIVAFTFTNNAADSIRQRVATALHRVGRAPTEVGKISIGTIHSFCEQLLAQVDARYRQFDVLDQNRLHLFLMSRYAELGINIFEPRESKFFERIKGLSDAWTTFHDEVLDIDQVRERWPDLGNAFERLRQLLDASNYIDFSLMIRSIVDRLQADDPQTIQAIAHVRHLLVDEYQDTNPLQERLIQLLRRDCETLTVVGDDDQSIYGWRGADVTNIIGFADRNSGTRTHTLGHNFRSTPLIVRSADVFVRAELGANRLPKNPTSDQGLGPDQVGVFRFDHRTLEANWVADRILALRGQPYEDEDGTRGLTYADFAVLMRSTGVEEQDGSSRSAAFTTAFADRDIHYTLEAGGSVFGRPQVDALRGAMELLRTSSPDRPTVLHFINEQVRALFPNVREAAVMDLYARWGRDIHTPHRSPAQTCLSPGLATRPTRGVRHRRHRAR